MKKAFLCIALLASNGCSWALSAPKGMPKNMGATPERCSSLSDRSLGWGAVAAGAGALGGGSGLSTIAVDDKGAKIAFAVSSAVFGAIATGSVYLSKEASSQWAKEGCGQ